MNPNRVSVAATAVITLLLSSSLSANDAFLPGDAFFLSRLGEDSLREWEPFTTGKTDEFLLTYLPPFEWTHMGPKAGFTQLRVNGMSPSKIRRLSALYHHLRRHPLYFRSDITYFDEKGLKHTKEQAPFLLLVYNRSFGGGSSGLGQEASMVGLLYNEMWMSGGVSSALSSSPNSEPNSQDDDPATQSKFGMGGESRDNEPLWQYRSLLPGNASIIEDWKHGRNVPGLRVGKQDQGPRETERLTQFHDVLEISVTDIQLIIVPQSPCMNGDSFLESFSHREEGAEVFLCIDDEIKRCRWKENPDTTEMELETTLMEIGE